MAAPKLSLWYSEKEDDGRAYRNPVTGGTAPSVTTVLKYEAKDQLISWAANEQLKWDAEHWYLFGERDNEEAFRLGRGRWRKVRDERAEVGTGVHEYIEAMLTDSWDFPELDAEQVMMVERFQEFLGEYHFKPLYVEQTMWSHEHDYAGTADWIAEVEGPDVTAGIYVGDNKTSKNTWPSHWMQLAALGNADKMLVEVAEETPGASRHKTDRDGVTWWQEEDLPKVDGSLILHLRSEAFKVLPAPEEKMPVHFKQFLSYRDLWGYDRELKDMEEK